MTRRTRQRTGNPREHQTCTRSPAGSTRLRADGARLIRDFKTAANFGDLYKTAPQNEQFILYMVLEMLKKDEKDRVGGALITALRKTKRTAAAKPKTNSAFRF